MSDSPPLNRSVLGRGIVFALYGTVAGYLAIVTMGGLFTGLYGKPPSPGPAGQLTEKELAWCSRTLVALRDELDSQVAIELERPPRDGDPEARWRRFQKQWLDTYTPAQSRCGADPSSALTTAFGELGTLGQSYDDVVVRLTRTRSSLATRLNATVDQWRLKH